MYNIALQASSALQQYFNGTQVRGEFRWEGAAVFLGALVAIGIPIYLYGLIRDKLIK